MAKVEEIVTAASGLERWEAERQATKLDKNIQQLKVAMAELDSVRPKKATYVKRANVFFVEKRDVIVKAKRNELKDKEKLRFDVGVHLRSLATSATAHACPAEAVTSQHIRREDHAVGSGAFKLGRTSFVDERDSNKIKMAAKRLVVIGGAGALGRGVVSRFTRSSWKALSVDFAKNDESTDSFVFDQAAHGGSTLAQAGKLLEHVHKTFGQVDAVVCTAGGWAGGSIKDADSLENLAEMHTKNAESALLAAHVASHALSPGGLLVLTGAAAALQATPGMVSYGMSKAATHHLIASSVDSLPKDATVLGVLPVTIDTPMNRKYMGDADFSTWTTPEEVADKIIEWSQTAPSARPASGHLISVRTQNNASTWKDEGNPFL